MTKDYGRYRKICSTEIVKNKYHLEILRDVVESHYILKVYQFSDIINKDSLSSKKNIVTKKCKDMEEVLEKVIEEVCKIL